MSKQGRQPHRARPWQEISMAALLAAAIICAPAGALAQAAASPPTAQPSTAQTVPQVSLTPEQRATVDKALAGDAQAQSDIGMMFYSGAVLPQNDIQAAQWFRLSADQGNADGAYNLALMYINGRGVTGNDAQAVKWLTASAMKGQSEAQLMLGLIHSAGVSGVPADDVTSIAWTELAAAQGNTRAQAFLDMALDQLSPESRQAADDMARRLHGEITPSIATGHVVQPADLPKP